jgi:hypothetical protein
MLVGRNRSGNGTNGATETEWRWQEREVPRRTEVFGELE